MSQFLSCAGVWIISDAIYSWVLYANSQSWRGEKQSFLKDHWVRLLRGLIGVGIVVCAIKIGQEERIEVSLLLRQIQLGVTSQCLLWLSIPRYSVSMYWSLFEMEGGMQIRKLLCLLKGHDFKFYKRLAHRPQPYSLEREYTNWRACKRCGHKEMVRAIKLQDIT